MRSLRLLSIVAACVGVVGSANAAILYQQAMSATPGGSFSNALASGGGPPEDPYYPGQAMADDFVVSGPDWNVTKITFWGMSEYAFYPDLRNFTDLEVRIMDALYGNVDGGVFSTSDPLLNISQVGTYGNGANIYRFELSLNTVLSAGSYRLHVGAQHLVNAGDAWIWMSGDASNMTRYMNFFDGNGWNPDYEAPHNFAFQIDGNVSAVPEPFTMALGLGAAGAYIRRRRRK